jgi:WD40 repeat protein
LTAILLCCVLTAPAFCGNLKTLTSGTTKDLYAADYHPDDSYALVVGDGVFTYDRASGLVNISSMGPFYDVDWRPQGDYALLVGDYGLLYEYDGKTLTQLNSGVMDPLYGVAFSPSGDHAVMVGYNGTIIGYDGATGALSYHSIGAGHALEGVTWNPNGLTALIVGIQSFSYEEVIRYDRYSANIEWQGSSCWPGGIAYHPTDDYALIVEDWGHAAIYDSNYYTDLPTGFEQVTDGLNSVEWAPDGSTALITGAWFHSPFPGLKTLVEYNGKKFNILRMFEQGNNYYENVAWKSDSLEALVVGRQGEMAIYRSKPSVIGGIHTDAEFYNSGDTMVVSFDVENTGSTLNVEGYITLTVNFANTVYWPGFGKTPVPIARTIPAGANVQGRPFFKTVIPPVNYQTYINWNLWLFEPGSMDYDDLFSYSTCKAVIDP